jgi:putative transposase
MAQGKKSSRRRKTTRSSKRAARRRRVQRRAGELRRRLKRFLPDKLIQDAATETGWVERVRKIRPQAFVWALVLGFAGHTERTIATLRREFERATGLTLAASAFYDRFNEPLVQCLCKLVGALIEKVIESTSRPFVGALQHFKDVVVTDSSVIRLHDFLEKHFPGSRTNHSKAAMKLHVVMSVLGAGPRSFKVTSGRTNDGRAFTVGPWIEGKLLLFDLGYFCYRLFDNIRRNKGFFVSRLKANANPVIVANNRACRGHSVELVGKRLREVLPLLQREVLDVDVEVAFKRRPYRARASKATARFRVVGVRDEATGEYHLYITNLPVETFDAETVARIYKARWSVELLFKSLKSDFALEDMHSEKPAVVEALLYASIMTWLVGQELLALIRLRLKGEARRATNLRWSRLLHGCAIDLLRLVVGPPGQRRLAALVERFLLHEAIDPHQRRHSLLEDVETGEAIWPPSLAA